MSSLQKTKSGFRVQFKINGKSRQLSLPGLAKRQAEQIQRNIDHLIVSAKYASPLEEWCQKWLSVIDPKLLGELRRLELTTSVSSATQPAIDIFDDFMQFRSGRSASTQRNDMQFRRKFKACFGNKPAAEFTYGDGEDFREFCLQSLEVGENTTRKRCAQGSTFFRWMIKRKFVPLNAFDDVPKAVGTAIGDKQDIGSDVIELVMREAPTLEWKALIVLGRWGGLRVPSEAFAMRWEDINWQLSRFIVNSPKTVHQNKPKRTVPLFPELVGPLMDLSESQRRRTEFVLPTLRAKSGNVGTPFRKIIERAGIVPWPKPWSALRSTRETELAAIHPIHVVCEWMGNTIAVARRHYLKATESDFIKASADNTPTSIAPTRSPLGTSETRE